MKELIFKQGNDKLYFFKEKNSIQIEAEGECLNCMISHDIIFNMNNEQVKELIEFLKIETNVHPD